MHYSALASVTLASLLMAACGNTSHDPGASGGSGQGGSASPAGATALNLLGVMERRGASCSKVSPAADSPLVGAGILDRALAATYEAALLVENSSAEALTLRAAAVTIETSDGRSVETFESMTTGFVGGKSAQAAPSLGALLATLVSPVVSQRLELGTWRLRVRLLARGQASGTEVESGELLLPLELCEGCLVTYPESARDPDSPDGAYLCITGAAAASLAPGPDAACSLGIDAPAPCTTCSDQVPLCRDPALNPQR